MTTHAPPQGRQGIGTQLAMTALTLAVVGAFVLWQVRPGPRETVAPVARSAAQRSATEEAVPVGGLPKRSSAAARVALPAIYIVESHEQAQVLLAGIEQANAIRATAGEPQLVDEVAWFDSAEAEVGFWAMQADHDSDSGTGGAPSIIDLRGRMGRSCFEQEGTIPDVVRDTCSAESAAQLIYLVGSEAEAEAIRQAWAVAAIPRVASGLAPVTVQVLVVTTDEDAAQIRLGQERSGVRVLDRRRAA